MGRSGGVRGERTDHTKIFRRTLAGFGLTWHQKDSFSTFDGKLELQCTRNGPQNPPFCPGSIQDTFIIYSSISHNHCFQHLFQKEENEKSKSGNLEISKVDPGKLDDSFFPRDGPVVNLVKSWVDMTDWFLLTPFCNLGSLARQK